MVTPDLVVVSNPFEHINQVILDRIGKKSPSGTTSQLLIREMVVPSYLCEKKMDSFGIVNHCNGTLI